MYSYIDVSNWYLFYFSLFILDQIWEKLLDQSFGSGEDFWEINLFNVVFIVT